MVLQVMKWDIRPDKVEDYLEWAQSAIKRTVGFQGVVEFRAYRPVTGDSQVAVTTEFVNMEAWAAWHSNEDTQKVMNELYKLARNIKREVWGPSPVNPEPIRP